MKAIINKTIKTPKGWHRLRKGTWTEKGDRYLSITEPKEWVLIEGYRINYIVGSGSMSDDFYIRKNPRRTV